MPDLPTFTVSAATATRLLNAFAGEKDYETGADITPQQAYKRWLKRMLMERVTTREAVVATEALSNELT